MDHGAFPHTRLRQHRRQRRADRRSVRGAKCDGGLHQRIRRDDHRIALRLGGNLQVHQPNHRSFRLGPFRRPLPPAQMAVSARRDDWRGRIHGRFLLGTGHLRGQHVPHELLHFGHWGRIAHAMHAGRGDLLPDAGSAAIHGYVLWPHIRPGRLFLFYRHHTARGQRHERLPRPGAFPGNQRGGRAVYQRGSPLRRAFRAGWRAHLLHARLLRPG